MLSSSSFFPSLESSMAVMNVADRDELPMKLEYVNLTRRLLCDIPSKKRNICGYILFFLCTLALIVIDLAISRKGGIGNYISIFVFVIGFGVEDAHVQGRMVGDLAFMKPEFMQTNHLKNCL
ncbi:hypothetical protein L1887_15970 [Cichorium endivia]|nr:hypothetical protein L1887_15970 [Cichorium endivia]